MQELPETIDAIRAVKAAGLIEQFESMTKGYVKLITSNSFNVSQNHEYLSEIDRDTTQRGIVLTIPSNAGYER